MLEQPKALFFKSYKLMLTQKCALIFQILVPLASIITIVVMKGVLEDMAKDQQNLFGRTWFDPAGIFKGPTLDDTEVVKTFNEF